MSLTSLPATCIHNQSGSYSDTTTPELEASHPAFVCSPSCGKCTVKHFVSEGCPKQTQEEKQDYPYLCANHLSGSDREFLEQKLEVETNNIVTNFSVLFVKVAELLEELHVEVNFIKMSVLSLEGFRYIIGSKVLDKEDELEIKKANKISEIFLVIYKYSSFFNYHIIKHIVELHGGERGKSLLEDYLEKFQQFCCRKNIFENIAFTNNSRKTAKVLVFKCREEVTYMEGVVELIRKIEGCLGLNPFTLQLKTIKTGCVELHFLISAAVADHIFPVSPSQHSALSEIGVKVLSCDDNESKVSIGAENLLFFFLFFFFVFLAWVRGGRGCIFFEHTIVDYDNLFCLSFVYFQIKLQQIHLHDCESSRDNFNYCLPDSNAQYEGEFHHAWLTMNARLALIKLM